MADTQDELLAVALEAARAGAAELTARFGRRQQNVRTKTTPTDPVSEADLAAERAVRAVLTERRPNDTVIGEEGERSPARATRERPAARVRCAGSSIRSTAR